MAKKLKRLGGDIYLRNCAKCDYIKVFNCVRKKWACSNPKHPIYEVFVGVRKYLFNWCPLEDWKGEDDEKA